MGGFGRRYGSAWLGALALLTLLPAAGPISQGAEPAIAIAGYDPVAYFTEGRATKGDPRYEYVWDDARYLFASSGNRDLFRAHPGQYAPQYPGYCAMSLADGVSAEPSPENWLVREGKLYLFGKAIGPAKFGAQFDQNTRRADENWWLVRRGDAPAAADQAP